MLFSGLIISGFLLLSFFFVFPGSVYASCPVCIVTVGGGLLIAEKLGIDPLLVSIWISGLNTAIAFWIASSFKDKKLDKPLLWAIVFYLFTLLYLQFSKQIGAANHQFLGIDKSIFGLTVGLILFIIAELTNKQLKKNHDGKVYFSYQKVVIPVAFLLLSTLLFKIFL